MYTPTDRRQQALERFEATTELPLLVLAVAMVPLLVLPLLLDLPGQLDATFAALHWFIWAAFAVEYVVRLVLSGDRWRYVRREWASLLLVVLPFLRPLKIVRSARALRVLRLVRLVTVVSAVGVKTKRLLSRHKLHYALVITLAVVVGAAAVILAVEEGQGGSINSFGDALWWAVTTVTTVGYGDKFPVTAAGRGVAAALMVAGITLFGVLTANLAAFMLEHDEEEASEPADDRLDQIIRELADLRAQLSWHCTRCGAPANPA